jgi:mRNA interferase YafQ
MRRRITKPQFDRDVRRTKRRGKDIEKLIAAVSLLEKAGRLSPDFHSHKLSGEYEGCWECHLEYDWLLIYELKDEEVILIRTGSHSDLFE